VSPLRAEKPAPGPHERPLFLREVIAAMPQGARVLDAGCGPGSWPHPLRPDLDITAFDIKFPPGPPRPGRFVHVFRGDLAQLPLKSDLFDLTVCHYVLEHVTELAGCCDELVRVTKPGGQLYISVPRAAAFDDRLYRFAGYFAKYGLMKFKKRLEHQQRFDFQDLVELFYARGMRLTASARVPAGFSWMNDPRTKPLQGMFTDTLATLHRATGLDLAADANFVMTFDKVGTVGLRTVTNVCRECGEHAVVTPGVAGAGGAESSRATSWECPYCHTSNPYGRQRTP
jgi:SAM-dependent methyltransferase